MLSFSIVAVQILILLNPFAVLSTFLSLTSGYTCEERRKVVFRMCLTVIVAALLLFFSGGIIFKILGINIDVFRIGGGVILMVCAITLVMDRGNKQENRDASEPQNDIAVVPIAIPMAVGPGTSAGLIVIGMQDGPFLNTISNLSSMFLAIALLTLLLLAGTRAEYILKKRGIAIITKLTGLFLSAIAASMILEGVKNFFHS